MAFFKNIIIDADWVSLNSDFAQIVFNSLIFTLLQAGASALLACFLGVALGAMLSKSWFSIPAPLRNCIRGLGLFYFLLPGVVAASIVIEIFKSLGLSDQGYVPVVAAHVGMNLLFIAVSVAERTAYFRQSSSAQLLEAAQVLGAPMWFRIKILLEGVWREQLKFFAPLVFLWSASSFATVIMLGGAPSRSTPEVLLFLFATT